jgi:hypothetical protein
MMYGMKRRSGNPEENEIKKGLQAYKGRAAQLRAAEDTAIGRTPAVAPAPVQASPVPTRQPTVESPKHGLTHKDGVYMMDPPRDAMSAAVQKNQKKKAGFSR